MIRDLMYGALKATYEATQMQKMQELKDINEEAYNWLIGHKKGNLIQACLPIQQ